MGRCDSNYNQMKTKEKRKIGTQITIRKITGITIIIKNDKSNENNEGESKIIVTQI